MISQFVAQRRARAANPRAIIPTMCRCCSMPATRKPARGMTDKEIVDEITTLIVAGHETTASALNWTWYLLGEHPEIEAKLHAEIDASEEHAVPSLQAMEALPYSNMVIREAMRLYPPVWVISRKTIEADTLGRVHRAARHRCVLSRRTSCTGIRTSGAMRRSSCPERFTRSDDDERPKLTYLPFSAGAHHCIGETLAIYECWCTSTALPAASACAVSTTTRWSSKP